QPRRIPADTDGEGRFSHNPEPPATAPSLDRRLGRARGPDTALGRGHIGRRPTGDPDAEEGLPRTPPVLLQHPRSCNNEPPAARQVLPSPTMTLRIGINGFGRIGRLVYRIATERGLDVIAINDVVPADNLAYLLAHDTMQGPFRLSGRPADVAVVSDGFTVDGKRTQTISVRNPAELPWKSLGVDYVLESTGLFTDFERAGGHLKGGAKRVVIA